MYSISKEKCDEIKLLDVNQVNSIIFSPNESICTLLTENSVFVYSADLTYLVIYTRYY